jgi:hypothetical protein
MGIRIAYIIFAALLLVACKKQNTKPVPFSPADNSVLFVINHFWENENTPFLLGQQFTHSNTNEELNFQTCNYYLSNFQLRKTNGAWWSHPNSYFLVRLNNSNSYQFELSAVPVGDYDAIRFLIGVDSAKNVSGAQAGDLAPSNGMFWSWLTGYIMIKLEGNSPQANWGFFSFHIGGFRKSDNSNVTQWKEFEITQTQLKVLGDNSPKVTLNVDVAKTWTELNPLSQVSSIHTPSTLGKIMANQFSSGFTLKKVE